MTAAMVEAGRVCDDGFFCGIGLMVVAMEMATGSRSSVLRQLFRGGIATWV